MRDDAKIRQAMVCLRDAERLLREAHMPQSAGGVTRCRVWLRWCLASPNNRGLFNKPGYKKPDLTYSERMSRGRKRGKPDDK